jgi:hypothetical protein
VERLAQLALCLRLDLPSDLVEVVEALAGQVSELAPLVGVAAFRVVQQLQQQRPARAHASAARQEVAADQALEHRRLAAALAPDDHDLRQCRDLAVAAERGHGILQLVKDGQEALLRGTIGLGVGCVDDRHVSRSKAVRAMRGCVSPG